MKTVSIKRVFVDAENGHEYTIISYRSSDDYVYFSKYYRSKNGKTYGNWQGLGWHTSVSHIVRGFRRRFKDRKMVLVKAEHCL